MSDEVDTSLLYDVYFDLKMEAKLGLCKFEFEIVDKRGHVVAKSVPYEESRKFEFEVVDNYGNVMTKGVMDHKERLLIEQLPNEIKKHIKLTDKSQVKLQINYLMIDRKVSSWRIERKGHLRKWYQVLNEYRTPILYSLPKFRKYPLVLYRMSDKVLGKNQKPWLRVERKRENYTFYDESNNEIAWIESRKWEGYYKEFKLIIQQLRVDFMLEIIAIAIKLAIQDARDTLRVIRYDSSI
ncbi:MAG: hypothetical protein QW270_05865 [Candidatus Bathyarchaeia archaeon]